MKPPRGMIPVPWRLCLALVVLVPAASATASGVGTRGPSPEDRAPPVTLGKEVVYKQKDDLGESTIKLMADQGDNLRRMFGAGHLANDPAIAAGMVSAKTCNGMPCDQLLSLQGPRKSRAYFRTDKDREQEKRALATLLTDATPTTKAPPKGKTGVPQGLGKADGMVDLKKLETPLGRDPVHKANVQADNARTFVPPDQFRFKSGSPLGRLPPGSGNQKVVYEKVQVTPAALLGDSDLQEPEMSNKGMKLVDAYDMGPQPKGNAFDQVPGSAVRWIPYKTLVELQAGTSDPVKNPDQDRGFQHRNDLDFMNFEYAPGTRVLPLYKDGKDFTLNNALNHPEKLMEHVDEEDEKLNDPVQQRLEERFREVTSGPFRPQIGELPGDNAAESEITGTQPVSSGFEDWAEKFPVKARLKDPSNPLAKETQAAADKPDKKPSSMRFREVITDAVTEKAKAEAREGELGKITAMSAEDVLQSSVKSTVQGMKHASQDMKNLLKNTHAILDDASRAHAKQDAVHRQLSDTQALLEEYTERARAMAPSPGAARPTRVARVMSRLMHGHAPHASPSVRPSLLQRSSAVHRHHRRHVSPQSVEGRRLNMLFLEEVARARVASAMATVVEDWRRARLEAARQRSKHRQARRARRPKRV